MASDSGVPSSRNLAELIRQHGPYISRIGQRSAYRLGLGRKADDIVQDAILKMVRNEKRIVTARNPLAFMTTIVYRAVSDAAKCLRIRMHVVFDPDANVEHVLASLGLDEAFKPLRKRDFAGRVVYSGLVWPSDVAGLRNHPGVLSAEPREKACLEQVDPDTVISPDQFTPRKLAELAELRTVIGDCFRSIREHLRGKMPDVFERCALQGETEEDVALDLGLEVDTVHRYLLRVYRIIRATYPWLREL